MKGLFVILAFLNLMPISLLSANYDIYYSKIGIRNSDRFDYAISKFNNATGFRSAKEYTSNIKLSKNNIYIGLASSIQSSKFPAISSKLALLDKPESFVLFRSSVKEPLFILAKDESGVLYAINKLITEKLYLEQTIDVFESPEMVLRGTSIGLQKTEYLPGRDVYEYPFTEESFPWFYDENHWKKYLDMMEANKYNSLYLWNGHPFSSLVKLKDYPYALEVDEATFVKNEQMYNFIAEEANKRGIWLIQMFYNILLPKPFAEKHNLKTQDRNRVITPLIEDYTRKSIAAFVEKYPNVGLLVTLGEAMEGVGNDDILWFTKTIIPGVKDGLKANNISIEPPIILRAHDTDAVAVMNASKPIYSNLYTMAKYNGEALTTYTPRGKWAELHQNLSNIGTTHVQNVHILANLEPFRYGSPDFIQKSVYAMHDIYKSKAIHIYPQASYWDWPYTADKIDERMLQVDRDWMWYKAWARYSWNRTYTKSQEEVFWSKAIAEHYDISIDEGKALLKAIEEIGEISPKILRRFGITDGNRQTSSLGMLMTQLINPYRYGLFTLLYESEAPEGEMVIEYAEKQAKGSPHIGETPLQVAKEIVTHAEKAVEYISILKKANRNQEDFKRWINDIHIHHTLAKHYSYKVNAALTILKYKYDKDINILRSSLPDLKKSVDAYKELVNLTSDNYLYANSMQTKQRKIPMRGIDGEFKHWKDLLPVFEKEYFNFKTSIDSLAKLSTISVVSKEKYNSVDIDFDTNVEYVELKKGAKIFSNQELVITHLPEELVGIKAIRTNSELQKTEGTHFTFNNTKPIKILVGFFKSEDKVFAPKPVLEIDASANNYGQAETKIRNALRVQYMPMVDIHTYSFSVGKNELKIPKGECIIVGIIDDNYLKNSYNADIDNQGDELDDLFGYFNDTKL
ncbi:hypothetical protein [Sphingobacterium bovistauri]|uniref:Glycosyl hydrolase family 20, domain 2 n=1 Tax=Sphingobacterium bovistauri TaxID=2781959 RepID=A0ABS7Z3P6_9SPHI|nr:hypothetical protein [Sphingobacterium bovistauri]MCA5004745.1 hypothetical protein [Sphingobacterium bovistauri]